MLGALMKAVHGPVYRRRIEVLRDVIRPHLLAGDRVLDVGCGNGTLGRVLLDDPHRPDGLSVRGLEAHPRDAAAIEVDALTSRTFPYDDGAFDVVLVLDVLHHDTDPLAVLRECRRVARRTVIVKDHKPEGPVAQSRICLLDWAANRPYGVQCLYAYPTLAGWHALFEQAGLRVREEMPSMRLYPFGWNWFFAGRLHYLAVLEAADRPFDASPV